MPHCYFVNDYRQSERGVVEKAPVQSREEYGLPPGGDVYDLIAYSMSERGEIFGEDWAICPRAGVSEGVRGVRGAGDGAKFGEAVREGGSDVVLCNFNRLHKIDPYTFDAWMEVRHGAITSEDRLYVKSCSTNSSGIEAFPEASIVGRGGRRGGCRRVLSRCGTSFIANRLNLFFSVLTLPF